MLETQLHNLGLASEDCLLILDMADADLTEEEEFAKFSSEWLFKLRGFGRWPRIILQASSYPRENPAAAKGQKTVPRREWSIWKRIISLDPKIREFVLFGDFGADHSRVDFMALGRAIPHLRYALETGWLIVKGEKAFATIRSVAKRIVGSGTFSGELFSAGDEFIDACARGLGESGSPTLWRSVNMNHHMTLVIQSLGALYGAPIPEITRRRIPVQESLFSEPAE